MRLRSRLSDLVITAYFAFALNVSIGKSIECQGETYSRIDTLTELPDAVRKSLEERGDLADRGEEFAATDASAGSRMPNRRFALAARGQDEIFVAVEHGGVGYNVEIWVFDLRLSLWRVGRQSIVMSTPATIEQLVNLACAAHGASHAASAISDRSQSLSARSEINGERLSDGSILIRVDTPSGILHYKLEKNPLLKGSRRYGKVIDEGNSRFLTAEEKKSLRSTLLVERNVKRGSEQAIYDEFLKMLDSD